MKKILLALLVGSLLSACATPEALKIGALDANSQVVQKDERIVAYFSGSTESMAYSAEPVEDGFVRKLLGTTADGKPVIQDFWAENNQKQIDSVVLNSMDALNDPSSENIEGWVTYYNKNGSLSGRSFFQDGIVVGSSLIYYPNGQLFVEIGYEKGIERTQTYFYQNGQKAVAINYDDEGNSHMSSWDKKGQMNYDEGADYQVYSDVVAEYDLAQVGLND